MCSTILLPNATLPGDNKTVKVDETLLSANATLLGAAGEAPEHRWANQWKFRTSCGILSDFNHFVIHPSPN